MVGLVWLLLAVISGTVSALTPGEWDNDMIALEATVRQRMPAFLGAYATSATEVTGYFDAMQLGRKPLDTIAQWKSLFRELVDRDLTPKVVVQWPVRYEVGPQLTHVNPTYPEPQEDPPLVAESDGNFVNDVGLPRAPPSTADQVALMEDEAEAEAKAHAKADAAGHGHPHHHHRHHHRRYAHAAHAHPSDSGASPLEPHEHEREHEPEPEAETETDGATESATESDSDASAMDGHQFATARQDQLFYGTNGKPGLMGGINVARKLAGDTSFGTMGLLLWGGQTTDDYRLFGLTNFHVLRKSSTSSSLVKEVCQPAPVFTAKRKCNVIGPVFTGCCANDRNSGFRMDMSVFEINRNIRWNHSCSVKGSSPGSKVDITGVTTAAVGDTVTKYGARTHHTYGTIQKVFRDPPEIDATSTAGGFRVSGERYAVHGKMWPGMADVEGAKPDWSLSPPLMTPPQEPNWATEECILGPLINLVSHWQKEGAPEGTHYSLQEATDIVKALYSVFYYVPNFSCSGDSGAAVLKGDKVVGLLNGGLQLDWDTSTPLYTYRDGSKWYRWYDTSLVHDINTVMTRANSEVATAVAAKTIKTAVTLSVCEESRRPKPAVPADCTIRGAKCTFPNGCERVNARRCQLRQP